MKKIIFFVLVIFVSSVNYSQELPVLTSHSPNVSSLGEYNVYPVDISTGLPKIEIPLYVIKSGKLTLPISLSYHASGIKVDQESSFVGLGWVLNAGGMITRIIQDKIDEDLFGFLESGGSLPDYNSIYDDLPHSIIGNDTDYDIRPLDNYYRKDKEPDLFNVQTANGLNANFSLNNDLIFVSSEYRRLKYDIDFVNETFIITDENGDEYRFGRSIDNEETFETTNVSNESLDVMNDTQSTIPSFLPPYNSSWHLTEIISANRIDTIQFKYKTCYYSNSKTTNVVRHVLTDNQINSQDVNGTHFNSTIKYSSHTTIANTRVLDKILFNNGSLVFSMSTDRLDVNYPSPQSLGVPRINGFDVYDTNGVKIKTVEFENNHYFETNLNYSGLNGLPIPINDVRTKRLKLNSIKFLDSNNGEIHRYSFSYDATPLPPKNTCPQDFWGYYNGNTLNTLIPESFFIHSITGKPNYFGANRDSNFDYMKAGTLNKIIYPTGGYTTYEFEPHYFLDEKAKDGKVLKKESISLFAINRLSSCPSGFLEGIPANNSLEFEVTQDLGSSYVWGELTIMFSDYNLLSNGMYMQYKLTNLDSGNAYLFEHLPSEKENYKVIDKVKVRIQQGDRYRLEAFTNGVTESYNSICNSPWIESTLTYDYYDQAEPLEIIPKQAGGLRVKNIKSYDSDDRMILKKKYEYGENKYGVDNIGVGTLITDPSKNFYYFPKLYYLFPASAQLKNLLWFGSYSQVELGSNNGSPVDYSKVTEYITSYKNDNLTSGKTEYFYSPTGRDVDKSWASVYRPYDRFIYPIWKGSKLLQKKVYKQSDDLTYYPVLKESYAYSDLTEHRIKTLKMIEQEPEIQNREGDLFHGLNPKRFCYYNHYVSIGKKVMSGKILEEYEYRNGLQIDTLNTYTDYIYDDSKHFQLRITGTRNSRGELLKTVTTYPQDIEVVDRTVAEKELINQHRIGAPIQTETFLNGDTISVQRTNYSDFGNGIIEPASVQTSKGTNLLEDRIIYHDYDDKGNPLEVSKADGTHIVYLWGYKKSQPIAKIEHATYLEVKNTLLQLQNPITIAALELASDQDNDRGVDSIDVNGVILPNGNEGLLRQLLNRVREALPHSLITTYTYDPLIGVTSITDPRGEVIYYHYDAFNRLEYVKDSQGNILSKNEYHYKGQAQ